MKILKRNYGHRNLIIFLVLSLVYLQAIYSLSNGLTFFSMASFHSFFVNHYFIFIITAIAAYMVMKIKKFSEYFLLICLIVIVGKNFILLSDSFNKLSLGFNFICRKKLLINELLKINFKKYSRKTHRYGLPKHT